MWDGIGRRRWCNGVLRGVLGTLDVGRRILDAIVAMGAVDLGWDVEPGLLVTQIVEDA